MSFSVDGKTPTTFLPFDGSQSANISSWHAQQFYRQDLVPGNHSILITLDDVTESQVRRKHNLLSLPEIFAQKLWIDSVVFEGTSSTPLNHTSSVSGTGSGSGSINSTSSGSKFSNAAIGGLIIAGIVLMVIFLYIRRRIQRAMSNTMGTSSPGSQS